MASIKKILLGLGIGGGMVAGGMYLWRLNKTSINLEIVPTVKLHKLDLQGIVLRVDVQLKNPTRTSLKLKFPFIKLLIKGSSIGSSQAVNQDIALPAFGEAKFEAIMIRIPMFSLLSTAKSLLQAVQQGEAFKIGVLIQEARKRKNLTQEELALKVGTTKNYISRIENNASDIRLSTLMRIIREGLDGHVSLIFDL